MKYIITLFLIAISCSGFAQVDSTFQTRGTILPLGASIESRISQYISFSTTLGFVPEFLLENSTTNNNLQVSTLNFYFNPSLRYYYNFSNRAEKERNIDNNSANYFALSYAKQNAGSSSSSIAGFVWGLQRSYPSRFYFDLNVGLGRNLLTENDNPFDGSDFNEIEGLGHIALGVRINK